jgi:hypothetical protein
MVAEINTECPSFDLSSWYSPLPVNVEYRSLIIYLLNLDRPLSYIVVGSREGIAK